MQYTFERIEKKYLLTEAQAQEVARALEPYTDRERCCSKKHERSTRISALKLG